MSGGWSPEAGAIDRLGRVVGWGWVAAYPVVTGPRTLFEVETPRYRLALTYMQRSRRWTITALDDERRAAA